MDGDLYIVMNDEELILLFLNRDEDAIRETAKQYGAVLRGVIRNILESEEDTDECLNDVYLALWQNIPSNRPENLRAMYRKRKQQAFRIRIMAIRRTGWSSKAAVRMSLRTTTCMM